MKTALDGRSRKRGRNGSRKTHIMLPEKEYKKMITGKAIGHPNK